ncbi:MAG: carbohydrate ABC transporter permease [Pirellulales bacterium]|nr:carbohydrate ABC transporter permease [Pirellulales bacterium]
MRRTVTIALVNAAVAALALAVVAPLAWMVGASLMPRGTAQTFPPPLWPEHPTGENFRELFTRLHLGRYALNSLLIALAITASQLLLNSLAGYAFAKLRFGGRDRLFALLLAALVVPLQVGMLPLFLLLKHLGLINTYWAVIIPSMATIYGIFMVRQYALSIPDSLLDAARIDGAGELRIYFSIVLPVLRPVLATLGIFAFLGAWNDFMWPLAVLTGSDSYTLPVALAIMSGEHVQDAELMMAGSLLTTLPVLLLFVILQRQLIGGIMMGGVKG